MGSVQPDAVQSDVTASSWNFEYLKKAVVMGSEAQWQKILAFKAVAKSKKALNHKDTKAQRKPFFAERSSGKYGRYFVSPCLCGSLLFKAFCDTLPCRSDDDTFSATASLKRLPGIGYCQVHLLRRRATKVVSTAHRAFEGQYVKHILLDDTGEGLQLGKRHL